MEAGDYKSALDICQQRLSSYQELQDYTPYISLVPLQKHMTNCGESSSCGVLWISQNILQHMMVKKNLVENLWEQQIPQHIIDFLLVHESLHTKFSITFQYMYKQHKDMLTLLHDHIIPEAIQNKHQLEYNESFITEKCHTTLAMVPHINVEQFMYKYFDALAKDMIVDPKNEWMPCILPYGTKFLLEKYQQSKSIATEILYNQDKQAYSQKLLTGLFAGQDLEKKIKTWEELYEEEWMVNYIAWLLTNVDIDEFNIYCPQDQKKIALTKKLQQKNISRQECFEKIKTWQDISWIYNQ